VSSAVKPSRTTWFIVGVVALIVAVAGIAAVTSGDDPDADVPEGVEQTRPVSVTGAPLPVVAADGTDPALGLVAPVITGATFDGTPVAIGPGSPTLVTFLAHWCPHCRAEVPRLVEWHAQGDVPEGLQVVAVATSTTSSRPNYPPSEWLAEEGWPFPVLADDEAQQAGMAMGLQSFPFFVLLDAEGTVLWRHSGQIEPDVLTDQITSALDTSPAA